jgi:hypothetical protein
MRSLVLVLVVLGSILTGPNPALLSAEVSHDWPEQVLWAVYWSTEPGFLSTLEMKNNRIRDTLTARVSLYFANGHEYYLPPITLGPREAVAVNLNRIMDSLPASVARGADKYGSIEVEYNGPNSASIMGGVSVVNLDQKLAWNFILYPPRPGSDPAPLQGLFWFPDEDTDGFVAVQNVTESSLTLTPALQIAGANYPATPAVLGPGQLYKLDLRRELRRLGLQGVVAGGIELTYQGEPDGIRAHGVLFNRKGFSAEIDFLRRNTPPAPETFFLRTPRFAFGPADPALGLPPRTDFAPFLALHNFGHYPMNLTLKVGYAVDSQTQEVEIAITLSHGATRILPLESYLVGIPPRTHWANLEIAYTGTHNNLAASMVSVSQNGKHSIRSVLNWVEASHREGWHWKADREFNTVVSVQNSDTEPAEVIFSLDYQDRGVSHSYDLPPFTIPARGTQHVNIGEVIAEGVPDEDGDLIPRGVVFGGYRARKIGAGTDQNITTEALIIDRPRANFLSVYNTGCCEDPIFLFPSSITDFVGWAEQLEVGTYNCTGEFIDWTGRAFKTSSNVSVATVDSTGVVSLVGTGIATVKARVTHLIHNPLGGCVRDTETPECSVESKPRLDSIIPIRAPAGAATVVTLRGAGFRDPATINAGAGIAVEVNSVDENQIVATFDIQPTAPTGNHPVTVTVATKTSNPFNFSVHACATPTNFQQSPGTPLSNGALFFTDTWSSSTGNQADLATCTVGETVFYPNYPSSPYTWPLPMVAQTINPTVVEGSGMNAGFNDTNSPPNSYQQPYSAASFNATQRLRWSCPCYQNGAVQNFVPDITITRRIFKDTDNLWKCEITKSGSTNRVVLPNQ